MSSITGGLFLTSLLEFISLRIPWVASIQEDDDLDGFLRNHVGRWHVSRLLCRVPNDQQTQGNGSQHCE